LAIRSFVTEFIRSNLFLHMKKMLIPSVLIPLAMICSCQKQDSAREQQLAQRKTELDARENALDEREKELNLKETALTERENALAKKEKAAVNAQTIPPNPQSRDANRDAAEAKTERDKRIQQLPPELRALIPDASQMKSAKDEKDRLARERLARMPDRVKDLQGQNQSRGVPSPWTSGTPVSPPPLGATSPTSAPAFEATSPAPSPTP
jgi:hypothetical protein